MTEYEVNPFRKLEEEGVLKVDEKWLEFEFHCIKDKAEKVLEALYRLGYRRYILDSPIKGVTARWQEIINGSTGEVRWVGTHISGTCIESQQRLIVDTIFGIGAVESGNDYYLNRIHFWDLSTRVTIGDNIQRFENQSYKGGEDK